VLGRIWAITINTFREAVRDRVLLGVLGAAGGVLLFSLALAELSLNQQRRVVLDVGLASISLFSVVMAVFLGSSLLYKEIERRTLYVILPKPIRRHEFLLGKYFGITLTASVFVCIMGAIQLWVTAIQANADALLVILAPIALLGVLGALMWRATDRTAVVPPWSLLALAVTAALSGTTDAELGPLLASLALVVGEIVLLSAVAMLFSSFSTPFLTGAFTVGVWLVGRSADDMSNIHSSAITPEIERLLHGLAWVVPNFDLFVPSPRALAEASDALTPGGYVVTTLAYGVVYAAILLGAACAVFAKRDFV
jgi:ABC-type transport system involved in multi-copper enzyme maturation permease subunit